MDISPLIKLPRELRDHIYEHILYVPGGVHVNLLMLAWRAFGWREKCPDRSRLEKPPVGHSNLLAITRTCKQLRHETNELFYRLNDFILTGQRPIFSSWEPQFSRGISAWLRLLGPDVKKLQSITIDLGDLDENKLMWPGSPLIQTMKDFKEEFEPLDVKYILLLGIVPSRPMSGQWYGHSFLNFVSGGPGELKLAAMERIEYYREETEKHEGEEGYGNCLEDLEVMRIAVENLFDTLEEDEEWTWNTQEKS